MSGLMEPPPEQRPPDLTPGEALTILLWLVAGCLAWLIAVVALLEWVTT